MRTWHINEHLIMNSQFIKLPLDINIVDNINNGQTTLSPNVCKLLIDVKFQMLIL